MHAPCKKGNFSCAVPDLKEGPVRARFVVVVIVVVFFFVSLFIC